MSLRKSFSLLTFAAFLLWIAAPAIACFSEGGMRSQHDCCAVMQICDATMSSSCCQLAPTNNVPAASAEISLQYDQQPALLSGSTLLAPVPDWASRLRSHEPVPAPDLSPGRFSILRI